ncbi:MULTISPECIES: hypothetical protein [Polymorphospora]|uniref:Uncharacterized protein n=1 Tax=Polymorphospora lycopeni TaxID=3140240 RepID=A0ABV5CXB4_9ACTN
MINERVTAGDVAELPWQLSLGLVLVDEKPSLYALYDRGGMDDPGRVAAWVVALPDGAAVLLPTEDGPQARPILTTLHQVRRRWSRLLQAELVQVAGRRAQHLAA